MTSQPSKHLLAGVIVAVVAALLVGAAIDLTFPTDRTTTTQVSSSGNSVENLSLELALHAHVSVNGTCALTIVADETNLLDKSNNVSTATDWPYPNTLSSPCGNFDQFPLEYAVFQGYYDATNYTSSAPLALFDTALSYPCPTMVAPSPFIVFAPLSDNASRLFLGDPASLLVAENATVAGYWTGSQTTASLSHFPPGVYTVLAEDEWGSALLLRVTLS